MTTASVLLTSLSQVSMEKLFVGRNRLNFVTRALLQLMALQYNTRPSLRSYLKGRDGWIDFSVGIMTETGGVEQSISFVGGRVKARSSIPDDVDVTLRFVDEDALFTMIRATPNEVLLLILNNKLIPEGNWAYLQLFNYLVALLLGRAHQRMLDKAARDEHQSRKEACDPCDPDVLKELQARTAYRMRGHKTDPGVHYLEDPYLSEYSLSDFPRLEAFLDDHLEKKPEVCSERPLLITQWFREHGFENDHTGQPWDPVARQGKVFKHLMSQKTPVVRQADLLPGTTTTQPTTGSVVFPDAQGTMIWGELDSIDKRLLIPFDITRETAQTLHHDVFPFWSKRNFREWARSKYGDRPSQNLGERGVAYFVWKLVGISHTIPDFRGLLSKGTRGLISDLVDTLDDPALKDEESRVTYQAQIECLQGVNAYAAHLAAHAANEASQEPDPERKQELEEIARVCAHVPQHPARTLHEALTAIWIAWVALHNENADTGLSLGRLDQLLQPYFEADLLKLPSNSSRQAYIERAIELAGCFFMRCTDHFPLSPDLGNYLFGGASSTQALTLGGVTPNGQDGVSDMTYIFLKVTEMLSIRDVNVNARFKPGVNSDAYLSRVCEVNFITAGTPSMHNDDAVFAALRPHGYDLEDIRDWSATGCVEPTITGKHMAHTGSILMNLVAGFEMTLNNGRHPLIRGHAGPSTGDVSSGDFETFEDFFAAYATQQGHLIGLAVELNNHLAEVHAQFRPTPLLSALMGGTLQSGRDVTRGGAQFNSSGTSNIGLADVTDSLLAIKKLVFDDKRVSFAQLKRALDTNFEEDPALKALAEHGVPHFGSGDEEALAMANRVLSLVHDMYGKHENYRGGPYTVGFWSMSQHVAYGNLSGALPSGRLAYKAFTPGLTPHPSASKSFLNNILDVARLTPEHMDNNMAFNVKLVPDARDGREKTVSTMRSYVKTYFEQGGMQIQFNVVTADTLRDAMAHPENYRGLLVRISGYNAYFVELIERAEYGL